MSHTSADVGNGAPGHGVTLAGDRFTFRHLGAAELAEYQRRRFEEERDELRLLRDDYPADVYVERLDGLREAFRRGEYDFLADVERAGLRADSPDLGGLTPEQRKEVPRMILRVMRVMTGRPDGDNWRLFLAMPEEVGQLMKQVIEESFPRAGLPTGAAPAAPG